MLRAYFLQFVRTDTLIERRLLLAGKTVCVTLLGEQLKNSQAQIRALRLFLQCIAQNAQRLTDPAVSDINARTVHGIGGSTGQPLGTRRRNRNHWRCRCRDHGRLFNHGHSSRHRGSRRRRVDDILHRQGVYQPLAPYGISQPQQ